MLHLNPDSNLSDFELLTIKLEKEGAKVLELDYRADVEYGKYADGYIGINRNLADNIKYEILAEEAGHHRTTYGDITDLTDIKNRKLEDKARREGYNILLKPDDLLIPLINGARNAHEFSEYLNHSEKKLLEIFQYWKKIYGLGIYIGDYYLNLAQL
ncbi:hypothetical protein [uncultured Clostridium sp.]|uniref:hypothetical protein n=1 Tax=uncultured Clostridium sp. TaxID=59620 RepID=UPI0025FE8E77|nr:hypothetical protein [uncultured Clostridium sp.]